MGTAATFSASATCGIAPQLRWWIARAGLRRTTAPNWSTSGLTWDTTGAYQVDVRFGFERLLNTFAGVSDNRVTTISEEFDPRLAPLGCAVTPVIGLINSDALAGQPGQEALLLGWSRTLGPLPGVPGDRFLRRCAAALTNGWQSRQRLGGRQPAAQP